MIGVIVVSILIGLGLAALINPDHQELYELKGYIFIVSLYSFLSFLVLCGLITKGRELE